MKEFINLFYLCACYLPVNRGRKRVATQLQNQLSNTLVPPSNAPPTYVSPLIGAQQKPQQQQQTTASSIQPPEGSTRTVTPEGNVVYTISGTGTYLVPRYEEWRQGERYLHRSWEEEVSFNYLKEEYTYSPSGELLGIRKYEPNWREVWGGNENTQQYNAPFGSRIIEYTTYSGDQPVQRTQRQFDVKGDVQFKTFTNFAEGTVKQKKFDLSSSYVQGVTPKGIYVPVGKNTVLVTGAQGTGLYKSGGWQTVVGIDEEGAFYGTTYNPGRALMESFYAKEYATVVGDVNQTFGIDSFGADPALFGMLGEAVVRDQQKQQREAWKQAYREGQQTSRFGFEGGMSLVSGEEVYYNPVIGEGQALSGEARVLSNPFKPGLVTTVPYGQQPVVSIPRTSDASSTDILSSGSGGWLDSAQKKYEEWKGYVETQSAKGNFGFKAVEYATAGGEFLWETINPPSVARGIMKSVDSARTIPGAWWDLTSNFMMSVQNQPKVVWSHTSKDGSEINQVWQVSNYQSSKIFQEQQQRIRKERELAEQFVTDPDVWQAGTITGGIALSAVSYPFFIGRVGLTALGIYGTYEQAKETIKNPTPKNIMGTVLFAVPTGMEAFKVGREVPAILLTSLRRVSPATFDSLMGLEIAGKRVGKFVPIEEMALEETIATGDFQRVKNKRNNIASTFEEFEATRKIKGGVFDTNPNTNIKWVSATGYGIREGKSLGILPGLASDAERARFIAEGAPLIGEKWTFKPERWADDPGMWVSAYKKATLYFLRVGAEYNYGGLSLLPDMKISNNPALIVGTADEIVGLPKNIQKRPIYRTRPGGGLTVEEYERQYRNTRTLVVPKKSYMGSRELQSVIPYSSDLANVGMSTTWIGDLMFGGKADYFTIWRNTIIPIQKVETIEVLSANMNRALITTGGQQNVRTQRRIGGTLELPDYTQTLPQTYTTGKTTTGSPFKLLEEQKKLTYSSTGEIKLTRSQEAQYSGFLQKYGKRSSLQPGIFNVVSYTKPTNDSYTSKYITQNIGYNGYSVSQQQDYYVKPYKNKSSSYYYSYKPTEYTTKYTYKTPSYGYKTPIVPYKTPPYAYKNRPTTYRNPPYGYKTRPPTYKTPPRPRIKKDIDFDFGGKITVPKRRPTKRKTKYQPSYRAIDLGIKAPKGFNKKYYTLIGVEERGQ